MATHSSVPAWRIPMNREALVGCSPWGHKDLDTTERLSIAQHRGGGGMERKKFQAPVWSY